MFGQLAHGAEDALAKNNKHNRLLFACCQSACYLGCYLPIVFLVIRRHDVNKETVQREGLRPNTKQ